MKPTLKPTNPTIPPSTHSPNSYDLIHSFTLGLLRPDSFLHPRPRVLHPRPLAAELCYTLSEFGHQVRWRVRRKSEVTRVRCGVRCEERESEVRYEKRESEVKCEERESEAR